MAEQNQIDFSQLEGVTPVTNIEQPPTIIPKKNVDVSKIDFSKLEGVKPIDETKQQIEFPKTETTFNQEEPSWFRKFMYGFDKQDQFFGNVFRLGKAKLTDIKDEDRDLKQVLQDNAGIENQKLLNKFQRFRGGKYDNDIYTKAGEMASLLLDPFYLLAYLTPWGRAATMSYKGLAMVGGATVGLDKLLSDYVKTGELKPKEAALAAGSAAVLGPAAMKTFKTISKVLPGADKKKIAQVIQAAEGAKAKKLGLTKKEFSDIQKIVGDKEFITTNNLIRKTGENLSKPYTTIIPKYNNLFSRIKNNIKDLEKINKEKFTKKTSKKIEVLKNKKAELKKEFKIEKASLDKKQSKLLQRETELINKRDVKILEKLKQNESFSDATVRYVLNATTRPLFGAGVGYAFGTLWGSEDDDMNKWIIGGLMLGGLSKGVQASKVLQVGDKTLATNIIKNEAVKLTLQKIRELTSTTTATKLSAFGGKTEAFGKILLQNLDSPYAKNSVSKVADEIQRTYTTRAVNITKGYSKTEQTNVLNSLRGGKNKLSGKEKVLKNKINSYLNDFKKLYNEAGIFSKQNIKDYFPRVYNFDKINNNPKEFEKVLREIFKNKGSKNPANAARKFKDQLNKISSGNVVKTNVDDFINDKKISNNFIITPLSNHINQQRILTGPYSKVEKLLSDSGFLINDTAQVLSSLVNRSANSIAFSQRFGANGQFLKPFYQAIKDKYKNTGNEKWRLLAQKEIKLVNDTIDACFDRFGKVEENQLKALSGTFATISNLNMLDRVTIASLGDLVQPFTNSSNWTAWLRALRDTSITARGERGVAKNLGLAHSNEIKAALQKPLAIKGDEMTAHSSWLGNDKLSMRAINNAFFSISGLQWLTGFARRFAYNAGANDAYITARKLSNYVSRGNSISSPKAAKFIRDLERYGITAKDALNIGTKSYKDAINTAVGKKNLNDAGILAANRDAIIPQVSNRLLFTQSNTPWVRLMGQFLSWAMAKSAQTNRILQRVENGDARTMVKILASIPVYGGIQELRELAKYGEVQTDIDSDTAEWWSEALRLSGMAGVGPEFIASNVIGPGSRQPFFLGFPAGSIAFETDKILKDYFKGNTERATERFFQRIFPLPNWRNFILERGKDLGIDFDDDGRKLPETKLERRQFNKGDVVLPKEKPKGEDKDMNIKNAAKAAVVAGAITIPTFAEGVPQKYPSDAGGVIIEEAKKIDKMEQEMEKAMANNIVPKKKPRISNLDPKKKKWLFDTAALTYKVNKSNPELNAIMIAMNSEETGWGTSRFLEEGSNNLYNIQVFNKDEPHIKAKGSNAMVKKYKTKADSIKDFLNMVNNSPNYAGVRETIEAYKKGDATQGDIVDAIQATGWAENPKWADNVKAILSKRIEGKNKSELKKISDKVNFVDKG